MSALVYLLGAAGVAGILYATEDIPSSALAKSWAADAHDFFCTPGTEPADPSFKLAGENFAATVVTALLVAFITYKYAKYTFIKILSCTAIIYTLTFAIIGFMRYTTVPQFKNICAGLAVRTQASLLTESKDLITSFLHPLQFLPPKPFSDNIQVAYTYAVIYPHLGEYLLTIEPYLPYFFALFGLWLEIRPLKAAFWTQLPIIGAVVSFAVMAVAEQSDFINAEPKDLLLNTILQYVIFYLATFVLLALYVVLFRLGMRRISVLGLFLVLSRLHILGLPKLEFHLETLLIILLISILVVTCEFSPGTFVLFSLAAHYFNWAWLEWGLIAMLVDNGVAGIVGSFVKGDTRKKREQKRKVE